MAKKAKMLCKWNEDDLNEKLDEFIDLIRKPKYICKKCGRVAKKKKWLHQPLPIK